MKEFSFFRELTL